MDVKLSGMLNGFPRHLQRDPERFDPNRSTSDISKMLDAVDGRAIAPGDSKMDEPGLISIRRRTGKAGNGNCNVGMGLPDRALCHSNGNVSAYRSAGINLFPAYPQQLAFCLLAIDREAPLECMARPLYVGQ